MHTTTVKDPGIASPTIGSVKERFEQRGYQVFTAEEAMRAGIVPMQLSGLVFDLLALGESENAVISIRHGQKDLTVNGSKNLMRLAEEVSSIHGRHHHWRLDLYYEGSDSFPLNDPQSPG